MSSVGPLIGWSRPLWIGGAVRTPHPYGCGWNKSSGLAEDRAAGVLLFAGGGRLALARNPCHQRSVMGFRKFSSFLAFSILVLCPTGSLRAAPFSQDLESRPDLVGLREKEARLLLAALVQDYVQMKASELEQEQEQKTVGSRITAQKRACNTATCVTHRLAGFLGRSGGVIKDNFVPTNVGSKAFGRRRRDLQA